MVDKRNFSIEIEKGTAVEIENRIPKALSYTIECGDFGSITFDVLPGGIFRMNVGTIAPSVVINDVDSDIPDIDNVVKIKNPD